MIPLYFIDVSPLFTVCTLAICATLCYIAYTSYKRAKLASTDTHRDTAA